MKGKNEGKNRVFDVGSEESLHGVVERAFEIGEGDVGIDTEPLDLVEDGGVGGVRCIVAMHFAGDHNTQRWRLLFHGVDLHRRGVGAHQQAIAQRLCAPGWRSPACPACRARGGQGGKLSDSKL